MWLVLLQAKSETAEAIKRIQALAEAECRRRYKGGGAPKSNYRRDDKVITDDGQDVWDGRFWGDGHDSRLPPQLVANAKPRWEDTTRGLLQQEVGSTSSLSV